MNNQIYLGQALHHQDSAVFHDFGKSNQRSLAIVGTVSSGKSNLLQVIAGQYKGKVFIVDLLNELDIENTTLIDNTADTLDFLKQNITDTNWKDERIILIDEVSDLLRGNSDFNKQCRTFISQLVRKSRHYNCSLVLCTQLPDYKSFGSDDTIRLLIRSFVRFNLPGKNDFTINDLDLSKLAIGECLYNAPALLNYGLDAIFVKVPHYKEINNEDNTLFNSNSDRIINIDFRNRSSVKDE